MYHTKVGYRLWYKSMKAALSETITQSKSLNYLLSELTCELDNCGIEISKASLNTLNTLDTF